MKLVRLAASKAAVFGDVEFRPGSGIVGWTGGTDRERRVVRHLLAWTMGLDREDEAPREGERAVAEAGEARLEIAGTSFVSRRAPSDVDAEGRPRQPHEELGLTREVLRAAWLGVREGAGRGLLSIAAGAVVRVRGGHRIERGLRRLRAPEREGGPDGPKPAAADLSESERDRREAELREIDERLERLEEVPARLRELEERLTSLRADAAEVDGDLEAESTDWLRRRQDAQTHLESYRDRARELRERMRELREAGPDGACPFCRRPLEERYEEVMAELDDEWERLVQDGSWWRRRRDQLHDKPSRIRELEDRAVRLRAEMEACAERLERRRFELRERDELRERRSEILDELRGGSGGAGPSEEERRRRILAGALRRALREWTAEERAALISAAGVHLNRISGGRILGLVHREGIALPLEDGRLHRSPSPADRAAVQLALRLAFVLRIREAGVPLESIVLGAAFRRLDPDSRVRALNLLREHADPIGQVLVLHADEAIRTAPEGFDRIVEMQGAGTGGERRIRVRPGGVGTVRLRGWKGSGGS